MEVRQEQDVMSDYQKHGKRKLTGKSVLCITLDVNSDATVRQGYAAILVKCISKVIEADRNDLQRRFDAYKKEKNMTI